MSSNKQHRGIKESVNGDPQAMMNYMNAINNLKRDAEALSGTQFGPQGTNGHLPASACGRVGGIMTKNVFLSFAGASLSQVGISPTPSAQPGQQIVQ